MAWIAAGGAVLGGALSGGLLGGSDSGPGVADIMWGSGSAKNSLLYGNPKFQRFGLDKRGAVPGLDIRTGFSSVDAGTGNVSFDPYARETALSALDKYTGNLGETRNSLLGNQGAFQQARVNPLLEQIAQGRGLRQRELSRTKVRGSFRDRALQDYDIAGERALGDARAMATNDSLNAINMIDQLMFNAESGTATNIFNQELAQLGFGLDTINVINSLANNLAVGAANVAQASAANSQVADQARNENILGSIGAGLEAYSTLKDK